MGLIQNVLFGLVTGSYIAIAAVGFTLIYGIVNMINFAYGEYMTVGAYVGFVVARTFGLPLLVAGLVAIVLGGAFSLVVAKGFFTPLQDAGPIPLLLTSIGLGFVFRNGIRLLAGQETRYYDKIETTTFRVEGLPDLGVGGVNLLGDFFVTSQHLTVIGLALVTLVATHLLLTRTDLGIAMRATADNEDLALVSGIETDYVRAAVWVLAGALAGLAGMVIGVQTNVNAGIGFSQLLPIIAAAILGGAGSPYGAVVGSYIIGVVMSVSVVVLPTSATQLGTTAAFLVLIVVLLVRPSGITGQEVREA
jgi:branched-chain amino acid transport system permease protein/neutral amino acid transport system permease protein